MRTIYSKQRTSYLNAFIVSCALLPLNFLPLGSASAEDCSSISAESTSSRSVATAGTWANFRNSEGSLRYESDKMIKEALAKSPKTPAITCPANCQPSPTPTIIFSATPHKILSDYSDKKECSSLLERTKSAPLQYPNNKFSDADSLSSWFNDFSQGKGKDGEDLYKKCYGSCSPVYETHIQAATTSGISAKAVVVCGHARDKSDDNYDLAIKYVWHCQK